jgi:tRNA (guanine37-N1)-methyltransferase
MMLTTTRERRPDLYAKHVLSKDDMKILKKFSKMEEK